MWDEIILVWNMQLLLKEWKKVYIACSDKKWLKNFHKQFFYNLQENENWFFDKDTKEQVITYVYELPKGFRSLIRLLKNIKDFKKMFEVDSILVWWWEILTEETPYSYLYWFLSTWILLPFKKLYLSWWIQVPKKIWNKILFKILTKKAEKIYVRDYDLIENWKLKIENVKLKKQSQQYFHKIEFFPDTSFFAILNNEDYKLDLDNYRWVRETEKKDYIIVNINKKAEQFYDKIYDIVEENYRNDKDIYFAWICKSPADDDIVYYHKLKKDFPWIKLLDWEDFYLFLDVLAKAEKVYTTRLHLFLVSYYLWLEVVPFVYQKKVEKMKQVLNIEGKIDVK